MSLNKNLKIAIVTLASIITTWYLFRDVIPDINHKYFAQGGDGAKDYFTMLYHIKHDTSYIHSGAMNYPYGENIFFCGAQPFLTNVLKFISKYWHGCSSYIVGIHNLSIIIAIALTVVVLFLIFQQLQLPFLFSLLASLGITFLSPQIDRMGGHFSLSYTLYIPLILYLILKFHENKHFTYSILILLMFIIVSFTHGYFFAFYAYLLLGYWIYVFFTQKKSFRPIDFLHIAIQLIVPIIIFQYITQSVDNINDRTSWPWGFLVYRAYPESVFISMNRPYWQWLNHIVKVRNVEWEGIAYVGLVSVVVFSAVLCWIFKTLLKKDFKSVIAITDKPLLNLFFWLSLILLLFSFGIPFIAKLEFLLEYFGPIRQFRGIGRFAWLFFYVLNITTFYLIWQYLKDKKYRNIAFAFLFGILFYDAWFNSKSIQYFINNRLPEFDYAYHHNPSESIQISQYQTIIPIPYFNTGSEAYWVDAACPTMLKSYALALYTGLPLNAVNMSRTSISQCVKNLELVWEPYKDYPVLKEYNADKFIMLYVDTACEHISENEKLLVQQSEFVDTLWGYQIRKISVEKISSLIKIQQEKLLTLKNDSSYMLYTYDSLSTKKAYLGKGALEITKKQSYSLFKGKLFSDKDTSYIISFWIYGMDKDMVPRNVIEVALGEEQNNWYRVDYLSFKDIIKTFDNGWGLLEIPIHTQKPNDYLSIAILKPPYGTPTYYVDNLMIRNGNVVIKFENGLLVNNRIVINNKN